MNINEVKIGLIGDWAQSLKINFIQQYYNLLNNKIN